MSKIVKLTEIQMTHIIDNIVKEQRFLGTVPAVKSSKPKASVPVTKSKVSNDKSQQKK